MRLRPSFAASCLAIALLAIGAAAQGADQDSAAAARPEVKVGDRWTYRNVDYWTNRTQYISELKVTFVGPDLILAVETRRGDDREYDTSWTADWNAKSIGEGYVFQPHSGMFRFPLKVGDAYATSFEMAAKRGSSMHSRFDADVRVLGWEDVVVPAGKFRTLKVEAKGAFRRVDAKIEGWTRWVFWYAPDVKRAVKFTYEDGAPSPYEKRGEELVEFAVQ